MARALNFQPWPVELAPGKTIPAAKGRIEFDGFHCETPGELVATNDALDGDLPRIHAGALAAGLIAFALDPEDPGKVTVEPIAVPPAEVVTDVEVTVEPVAIPEDQGLAELPDAAPVEAPVEAVEEPAP